MKKKTQYLGGAFIPTFLYVFPNPFGKDYLTNIFEEALPTRSQAEGYDLDYLGDCKNSLVGVQETGRVSRKQGSHLLLVLLNLRCMFLYYFLPYFKRPFWLFFFFGGGVLKIQVLL